MPKKPRSSRLSLNSAVHRLKEENERLRDALELIADVLEDAGIIDAEESNDDDLGEHDGDGEDMPQEIVLEGPIDEVEPEPEPKEGES